ncbi:hypothetical protein GYA54_04740 [Candidatus Kuenenbacteria bacterium]|nr:hypothetical protein [Candidatus Kuenenbacteria bacterium]
MQAIDQIFLARMVDGEFPELSEADWQKVQRGEQDFHVFVVAGANAGDFFGGGPVMLARDEATDLVNDRLPPTEDSFRREGEIWWELVFRDGSRRWIDDVSYEFRITKEE